MCKLPAAKWSSMNLRCASHPTIHVGYFYSHHQGWGYEDNDDNSEFLCNWISNCNMSLIHKAKDKGPFHSKDYNSDLCIVTLDPINAEINAENFPHSQHRPVLINWSLQIPIVRSTQKLC